MCVCVCVCELGTSPSFKHVSLNNKDKFCLYSLFKILSNTPYTNKQPLMMAYEGSESARDNFGKFIYQFQPETKTLIRKLEKDLKQIIQKNIVFII